MAAYQTQQVNVGSIAAPDVGSVFANFVDRINTNYQQGLTRAIEADKLEKDQKRWDITNARAEAQEKRAADEYERQIREKQATNDAVRAAIDPNGYKASKIAGEQKAIEASIANLSPEEQIIARAEIAKNYNPEVSGKQWVDIASNAQGVDVGRVLDTKSRQYEIAAKTPGTPEYIAAKKAELDLYEKEQSIAHKNRLAEIGAQSGAQLSYLKAQQDAPQKMVNQTTGEIKYVKPSEIDKYPGYIDAKRADARFEKDLESGIRREDARFEKELAYEFEGKKVKGMLDALNVDSTKPEEYVKNDALRKNIAGKQEVYGETYTSEINKVLPEIESINKNTAALKGRLTGNEVRDRGLLMSIKANEDKLAGIYNTIDKTSLGKSGMGSEVKEVPEEVRGTRDTVKTKAEFTKDMLKALGPNPSAEAVTIATQEIEKRYPKVNLSVEGYNQLAEQYGGKSIKTNDPAVAKENADAAVQVHKEKLNKQLMLNPISVDDTNRSLDELFKISSPDVIGTGDEYDLRNKIYSLKAQYQIPDKQMASIIDQSRGTYLSPWLWRVDEGTGGGFIKEIEQRLQALKPNKPN